MGTIPIRIRKRIYIFVPKNLEVVNIEVKYLLKTRGTASIPDYLQIRDESFRLIAHCKVTRPYKTLKEVGIIMEEEQAVKMVKEMPFGQLIPIKE